MVELILSVLPLLITGLIVWKTYLWVFKSSVWFWRGIICAALMGLFFIPIFIAPLFFEGLDWLGAIGLAIKTNFYFILAAIPGLLATMGIALVLVQLGVIVPTSL
ncbi:hypothetical protein ACL6C3_14570 [Capilliphycus salinus ALCB114379]|uniref:hypothetical protein n=1 Tax=Capilliphycus salinus TaxID=2768948 RepID=UPI0039A4110E